MNPKRKISKKSGGTSSPGVEGRIMFIQPSLTGYPESSLDECWEPMGLASLAGYLEEKGYRCCIVDCLVEGLNNWKFLDENLVRIGLDDDALSERIRAFNPDVIGIGAMFTIYLDDYLRTARLCKKIKPDCLLVAGGAHATIAPETLLEDSSFDVVIRGEAELTLAELIACYYRKEKFHSIKGVSFYDGEAIKNNPPRELIKDLDSLPYPARHLLPMEKYFEYQRITPKFNYYKKLPISPVVTSRGCPFDCIFCSVKTVFGRGWRGHSAEYVISELEHLKKEYGIREIGFMDDNISVDRKRIQTIAEAMIAKRFKLNWCTPNGIYLWSLDEDLLRILKKSGYYRATFGVDGGYKEILDYIGKPSDLNKIKQIIHAANRVGLWTHTTFIIGFPHETIEDIHKTVKTSIDLNSDFVAYHIAQPYPGTKLYDVFKKYNLSEMGEGKRSSVFYTRYNTLHFTAAEMVEIRQDCYQQFMKSIPTKYFQPQNVYFLLKKIASYGDFIYFLKAIKNILRQKWPGNYRDKYIRKKK